MLEALKQQVLEANLALPKHGLVTFTWGNVSGIDREKGLFVIKPSGVPYEDLKAEDLVVVDLEGRVVEGDLRPSSDTPTHMVLYRSFPEIGGVVHTHSPWGTSWAQAGRPLPAVGNDPCRLFLRRNSRDAPDDEGGDRRRLRAGNRECHRGAVSGAWLDPMQVPGILVHAHAPFVWGKDALNAVHNAVVLEEVAKITARQLQLNPESKPMDQTLLDRHFLRKHGANAYYGQK